MKRLIVLLLVLPLLCGCSQKKQLAPVMNNISFTAKIEYNKQKYTCDVELCDNVLNLVVNEPKEIKGLILKIDKNGARAEFMGISYDLDANSFPQGALADILFTTINDVSNKKIDINKENCEIKGSVNNIDYVFYFAPSGLPLSLKIDDPNLIIEFSNVTLK